MSNAVMPRVLVISPHLDDAAFSCAEPMCILRRAGWQIDVATVFTATVANPAGFALACQTDKGFDEGVDYMALRRAEDRDFLQRLDLDCHHLDLAEAPHRGYDSAAELFGAVHENDPAFSECEKALDTLIDELRPDVCIGPLGVGQHVDHRVVVDSLANAMGSSDTNVMLHFADQPYALRHPDQVDSLVQSLSGATSVRFQSEKITRRDAINAISAYTTQLGFQFGGEASMRKTLDELMRTGTQFWHRGAHFDALDTLLTSQSPTDQTR